MSKKSPLKPSIGNSTRVIELVENDLTLSELADELWSVNSSRA